MLIIKRGLLITLALLFVAGDANAQRMGGTAVELRNAPGLSPFGSGNESVAMQDSDTARKNGMANYIVIGAVLGAAAGLALHSAGQLGTYEAPGMSMMIFGGLGGLAGALIYSLRH